MKKNKEVVLMWILSISYLVSFAVFPLYTGIASSSVFFLPRARVEVGHAG